MKELDNFTIEQLNDFIKSDHAQCGDVAALARIALAAKRTEPVAYMTYKGHLIHAADPKLSEYSEPQPLYDGPQLNSPEILEGCPEFAEIYVGNDLFALCDWESFDKVKGYKWALTTRGRSGNLYAQAWRKASDGGREKISMHRLICGEESGVVYDHINGNGLDNRLCNLRKASAQQNSFNQKSRAGSSIYKGVSFDKEGGLWRSYITVDGKRKYLGRHAEEVDAAKAYDVAAIELFGSFARLNLAAAPENP